MHRSSLVAARFVRAAATNSIANPSSASLMMGRRCQLVAGLSSAPSLMSLQYGLPQMRHFSQSYLRRSGDEKEKNAATPKSSEEEKAASSETTEKTSATPAEDSSSSGTNTDADNNTASSSSSSTASSSSIERSEQKPNGLTRVKRMPLTLVEEVPLPVKLMGDLELIMTAWSEEQARQFTYMLWIVRFMTFIASCIIVFFFYRSMISSERIVRGVGHVPQEMKVGCVVYLDIEEEGREIGRIVIGLLTDICPLYCEYFHRHCTGNGPNGKSFRGLRMATTIPKHVAVFGSGLEMEHGLEGFDPRTLPTEARQTGPWRGCLSSIGLAEHRESPNFAIHSSSADYGPQVFGIVMAGYDVVERMHAVGLTHAANPRRNFAVSNCGELCTLDKTNIVPLPWKLYESVSVGYDEERFGPRSDWASMMPTSDLFGSAQRMADRAAGATMAPVAAEVVDSKKKAWYKFW